MNTKQKRPRLKDGALLYAGLFVCVVVEIALDVDDGCALIARTGGQVAQRTDQVGQAAGGCTLGCHLANQIVVLLLDLLLDGLTQCLTGQVCELVVGQILQLELVGCALEAGCVGGRDDGVGQLPDLADGILEGAVALNHDFHMLAGSLQHLLLNGVHQVLAVAGEQLDLIFCSLVGAQQAVLFIVAAAVDGAVHDLVETKYTLCTGSLQDALGARSGVDVAAEDVLRVVEDRLCVV